MEKIFKTFKIIIEYDGTRYSGWQRQKGEKTIQGELEKALKLLVGYPVSIIGSGRTDAGVHAFGQVASFRIVTSLNSISFYAGLNSILPGDIILKACILMFKDFNARFDAKLKIYRYFIVNTYYPPAIGRKFFWHIKKKLNLEAIEIASSYFLGQHDFRAFEGGGSNCSNTIRIITKSFIKLNNNGILTYTVEGNGFLRFMVRNIIGTLVDVGLENIEPIKVIDIINSKNRKNASQTAPPQGLFLLKVKY